jgi:NADH-quinone oxidoreductase subunit L
MFYAVIIGLFAPLAGFLTLTAFSRYLGRQQAQLIGCGSVFVSFLCFTGILIAFTSLSMVPQNFTLWSWIPVKGIEADFLLHIDPLSILMTLIITGIGFLIHVYSIGYMDHEEDYVRFFALLNFFIFAMLILVLAGHLLLLFVGWEGVGLASYLLIGFWYDRPSAAAAATKAFVVNRIGDFGLLLGLLLTFSLFGTGNMAVVSSQVAKGFAIGAPVIALLALLYFIGASGKSAQLPLHTWLPDAMEGPTPVSALIHAATMVTAGVYLVVRMHDIYLTAPQVMHFVGLVGGVTSVFAALCALGQTDLKRVLAYSTVSQLGLMFLACGVGAFYAAMFHLTTHAFIKAVLFLSAGNVVHMMHGTTEMNKMGGLSQIFTKTRWLFLIGVLALSGLPPFAAFFSKDMILENDFDAGFETFFVVGLIASTLTAFYLTRAYVLAFKGPSHVDPRLKVTEAPRVMLIPISVLAVLATFGGFLGFTFRGKPVLECFLFDLGLTEAEVEFSHNLIINPETWIAFAGAVIGVGSAYLMYTKWIAKLGGNLTVLRQSFYVDQIYSFLFVKPLRAFSWFLAFFVEPKVFEQSMTVTAQAAQGSARLLQKMQSGEIRSYVAWMVIGAVFLIVYFVL